MQPVQLVGRERELGEIGSGLKSALQGRGTTLLVTGEAGIGKTRLVQGALANAEKMGFRILSGACSPESARPFLPFAKALGASLFQAEEYVTFSQVLIIDDSGLLVTRASPKESEEVDSDIFAGMLTAVQNFVKDSFGGKQGSLGRLEYGDMKILMERTRGALLVAIFRGEEHEEMRVMVKATAQRLGSLFGEVLANWGGREERAAPVTREAESLARARFLVRRNLEGLKLNAERAKISDQVLGMLTSNQSAAPAVLVVEDLQWAD